jgi:hypothetical protein
MTQAKNQNATEGTPFRVVSDMEGRLVDISNLIKALYYIADGSHEFEPTLCSALYGVGEAMEGYLSAAEIMRFELAGMLLHNRDDREGVR